MNTFSKKMLLGSTLLVLLFVDAAPESPFGVGLVREANAVFGRPLSPVSFAGVARRTTRRAVVYGSAAAASSTAATTTTSQTQQAAPASQAEQPAPASAAPPPAPAAAGGAVPVGTVVTALPAGCTAAPEGGVQYYKCNGTRYRAAFQGNNLVYVAQ
jgi:hypothetical protein